MRDVADPLTLPRVPPAAAATHRRRDLVASLLFVVAIALIGVAAFRPRTQTALEAENRSISPWPTPAFTRVFTAQFERAFADRFGGRDALLRLHNRALTRAFGVSPAANVLIGRDGWLYFLGEDGTAFDRYYRGTLPVTDAQIASVVAELARRERFLGMHGIAYVVTIVPDKASIYPEHLPAWAAQTAAATPLARLGAAIRAQGTLRYVDLREPLTAAKARERVYYKTDSHWNSLGAAVGYRALMGAVTDALAPRPVATLPAFVPPYVAGVDVYRGDLARMTGDAGRFGEPDYAPLWKILATVGSRCAKRIDAGDDPSVERYACDRPDLPRAIVYRDSMAIPLVPLLVENFRRVDFISGHRLDPTLVLRERPDVVIDEMVERSLLAPIATPMP